MLSRTLVSLAERELKAAYRWFMKEQDPARREEAGKDLMRAIFGKDAIAEDTLLQPSTGSSTL